MLAAEWRGSRNNTLIGNYSILYIGIKRVHTSAFKIIFVATDVMFVAVYCTWYKMAAQLSSSMGRL